MTIAAHRRRLGRLERRHVPSDVEEWMAAVYAADREARAALALAQFAQALAGTEEIQAAARGQLHVESAPAARPVVPLPRPANKPSNKQIWTETVRPGPLDVLTWDEAIRVPWVQGEEALE